MISAGYKQFDSRTIKTKRGHAVVNTTVQVYPKGDMQPENVIPLHRELCRDIEAAIEVSGEITDRTGTGPVKAD